MATPAARLTLAPTGVQASSAGPIRLGLYAAVLTAVLAAVFAVAAVATPARSGPFCGTGCVPAPYTAVAQFIPGDYLWLIPGLLLAPIFVGLMACIHAHASEARKAFSLVAVSFAVIYAVVILVNYFVQFTVVVPSLQSGETQNLSLFTQYNPHGFFIALEVLAYLAMSAAFLAAAALFGGSRIKWAIRWLFVVDFILALAAFAGFGLVGHDLVAVEVTVLMINWVVLIAGGALLAVVFRRTARA
jgi:hypothetical protein